MIFYFLIVETSHKKFTSLLVKNACYFISWLTGIVQFVNDTSAEDICEKQEILLRGNKIFLWSVFIFLISELIECKM